VTKTYHYSVVAFVPHPVREERINLGVVLVADNETESDFKFSRSFRQKLRALAPDVHPRAAESFIDDFEKRFMSWTHGARPVDALTPSVETLANLASCEGGQIVFTEPRAFVTADSISSALHSLYSEYVASFPSRTEVRIGRPEVRTRIRRALRDWRVPDADVVPDPQLPGKLATNHLDVGVLGTNGRAGKLVAALEPISFQINSEGDIERHRDHIAWVKTDLPSDTEAPTICAVVTSPAKDHVRLHSESLRLFEGLGIEVVHAEGMDQLHPLLERAGVSIRAETRT